MYLIHSVVVMYISYLPSVTKRSEASEASIILTTIHLRTEYGIRGQYSNVAYPEVLHIHSVLSTL